MKLSQIAAWCGAELEPQAADIEICGISSDTRTVQPGELFIPLSGANFDGHTFLDTAADHGAAAVLSSRKDVLWSKAIPMLHVENTLEAYQKIAAGYRRTLGLQVVGITGSVGKTTTKEMTAAILAQHRKVHKTEGNQNNLIGLPKTVLSASHEDEALVVEMGMNHFGEISRLTAIAKPDVAVINNIGTMHIEFLGSRAGIFKAKMEIMEGLSPEGTAVLNGDEPMLWNVRPVIKQKVITFGIENPECDVLGSEIETFNGGIAFTCTARGKSFMVSVPLEGRHNVYNALAAIAASIALGASDEDISNALRSFQNVGMRQRIYERNGFQVIEDCYNAGPESMEASLRVLGERQCEGRRIAVLGSMLELGHRANAEHFRIGRLTARYCDMLLVLGDEAKEYVTGAITGGMPQRETLHFDSAEAMARALKIRARKGDTILFKGSRGMQIERVIEQFFAED